MNKLLFIFSIFIFCQSNLWAFDNSNKLVERWNELLSKKEIPSLKQSFCINNESNEIIGTNIDKKMKLASLTKLFVSYWSLKSLGPDYKFKTNFYLSQGKLYIQGNSDSGLVSEHLYLVLSLLNQLGIYKLQQVLYDSSLSLNWTNQNNRINRMLHYIFNTKKWNQYTKDHYLDAADSSPEELGISKALPRMFLGDTIHTDDINPKVIRSSEYKISIYSPSLINILKTMNSFSNNFMAEELFRLLGGSDKLSAFLAEELKITEEQAYFYTGSGLGNNFASCRIVLKLIQKIKVYLEENNLTWPNLLAIAGQDRGTLHNRFTEDDYFGSIAGKTGTLNDTSTLAGTASLKHFNMNFVILNSTKKVNTARKVQDIFLKQIIDENEGTNPFRSLDYDWNPLAYSMFSISGQSIY